VIAVASSARALTDVLADMGTLAALARDGANEKIAAALFRAVDADAEVRARSL